MTETMEALLLSADGDVDHHPPEAHVGGKRCASQCVRQGVYARPSPTAHSTISCTHVPPHSALTCTSFKADITTHSSRAKTEQNTRCRVQGVCLGWMPGSAESWARFPQLNSRRTCQSAMLRNEKALEHLSWATHQEGGVAFMTYHGNCEKEKGRGILQFSFIHEHNQANGKS